MALSTTGLEEGSTPTMQLPRELGLEDALRGKALHSLDDFKVGHIEVFMLGGV
jgi:hypothetical protein